MPSFHGRIEGLSDGILSGYVVDHDAPLEPVRLLVTIGDGTPKTIVADIPRPVRRSVDSTSEVGRIGFRIDLRAALAAAQHDLVVDVVTADGGISVPGAPVSVGIAADGYVDPTRGGVIVGWAHGPWFAPCNVELWSGETFLLSWPADQPREDLVSAGLGSGRCAFHIPIRLIFGDHPPPDLRIRIPGHPVDRPVPPDITTFDPPGRDSSTASANAFLDLDELYRSLERETEKSARTGAPGPGDLEISFATLQNLLDQIERLADERDTALARAALLDRRRIGIAPAAATPEPLDQIAERFSGDRFNRQKAHDAIGRELVEPFALDPDFRAPFLASLERQTSPELLLEVSAVFQAADFLRAAYLAQKAAIEQQSAPSRVAVERLRQLAAWVDLADHPPQPARNTARPPVRAERDRTLYCIWRSLPYETAGYDSRSHYLLRGLASSDADVIACTRPGFPWDLVRDQHIPSFEQLDGIRYVRLGGPSLGNANVPVSTFIELHARRIAHLALATGADLIHSATNWLVGLPALIAARRLGLPFVYEMRGLVEVTRSSTVPLYAASDHFELFRRMEAQVASAADLVFTITSGVRAEMARRGCDTSRFRLAPNGVDSSRFRPLPRNHQLAYKYGIGSETVFGFIGTFIHYEGLLDLCAAAAELKARGHRFKLLLVGDGPQGTAIRQAIARLGIEDVTILTGRVPFEQVPELYSLVDVAVYPRRGMEVTEIVSPLKPFEAMAMGKPVIGSDVAALADIIRHERTGWLFAKDDIGALTATMELAIGNPQAAEQLGIWGRAIVESEHDWTRIAGRMKSGWAELRGIRAKST